MLNYMIYFCKCAVEIWLDCKQLIQQVYHFRQMHSLTQATLLLLQGPVSLCMSPNLSKARSCISKSSLRNWPYSFPHIYKSPVASLTQFTMFFAFIYIYLPDICLSLTLSSPLLHSQECSMDTHLSIFIRFLAKYPGQESVGLNSSLVLQSLPSYSCDLHPSL